MSDDTQQQTITQEQFEVLLDNDKKIQSAVNDTNAQLDSDRDDIDKMKIDQGTIKHQQETLLDGISDLKSQLKAIVRQEIKQEIAKTVKRELNKIIVENPDKIFIIRQSFWDWVLRRK